MAMVLKTIARIAVTERQEITEQRFHTRCRHHQRHGAMAELKYCQCATPDAAVADDPARFQRAVMRAGAEARPASARRCIATALDGGRAWWVAPAIRWPRSAGSSSAHGRRYPRRDTTGDRLINPCRAANSGPG